MGEAIQQVTTAVLSQATVQAAFFVRFDTILKS